MLALTRKELESIIINGNIEIKVLSISGEQVKIGINAPKNILVHRKEIYDQIEEQNKAAITSKYDISKKLKDLKGINKD